MQKYSSNRGRGSTQPTPPCASARLVYPDLFTAKAGKAKREVSRVPPESGEDLAQRIIDKKLRLLTLYESPRNSQSRRMTEEADCNPPAATAHPLVTARGGNQKSGRANAKAAGQGKSSNFKQTNLSHFLDQILWKRRTRNPSQPRNPTLPTSKPAKLVPSNRETEPLIASKTHFNQPKPSRLSDPSAIEGSRYTTLYSQTEVETPAKPLGSANNSLCLLDSGPTKDSENWCHAHPDPNIPAFAEFGLLGLLSGQSEQNLDRRSERRRNFSQQSRKISPSFEYIQPVSSQRLAAPLRTNLQGPSQALAATLQQDQEALESTLIHNFLMFVESERVHAVIAQLATLLADDAQSFS